MVIKHLKFLNVPNTESSQSRHTFRSFYPTERDVEHIFFNEQYYYTKSNSLYSKHASKRNLWLKICIVLIK